VNGNKRNPLNLILPKASLGDQQWILICDVFAGEVIHFLQDISSFSKDKDNDKNSS
jgi:hypothetical protein